MLKGKHVSKLTATYIGENTHLLDQYLAGELELEVISQGTLAEKLRSGGAGIPAFYCKSGLDTHIEHGGFPTLFSKDNRKPLKYGKPKERRTFGSEDYILEESIRPDFAFVKGWKSDKMGNIIFKKSARNFNSDCAMAAKVAIVEVEEIVDTTFLPEEIHLSHIFVQRVV